jgi:hypothetical protein
MLKRLKNSLCDIIFSAAMLGISQMDVDGTHTAQSGGGG